MMDDTQLLRRYAETHSEEAFAELVRRHVNLVHSAALRQVNGDAHLAQDVTQLVFSDLARKADSVANHRVLAGWLFTSTRFAAAKLVRGERRRQAREVEAQTMNENLDESAAKMDWDRVRPVLDETLAELDEKDREAILLRFFEGRDFAEVGARLSLSGNAARMRVERALDKLHGLLARRGVTSTTAALAVALGGQAVAAAPVGLAAVVTGAALAGSATVATGAAAGGAWVTFMSMTKLQLGLSGALAVAGATGLALQARTNAELRDEVASLRQETQAIAVVQADNVRLKRVAAEVADFRGDDAALAELQAEAATLTNKVKSLERSAARLEQFSTAYDRVKLDRQPTPKTQVRPSYPAELREAGISGEVMVGFIIDTKGEVRNASPIRGTPVEGQALTLDNFTVAAAGEAKTTANPDWAQGQLEAAAVAAVSQWKFEPGEKGGRAVNTRMQVPIVFTLSKK